MKSYLYLILTLIFLALVGIGYLLYQNLQIRTQNTVQSTTIEEIESQNVPESTQSGPEQIEPVNPFPTGDLSGDICYPSESVPPLEIYVQNVETDEFIKVESELNQTEYEIENIPVGTYIAFAYVKELEGDGGGYTEAVPCGLTTECEDHTPIEFQINEDEVTTGVDICDWYGAEVPDIPL